MIVDWGWIVIRNEEILGYLQRQPDDAIHVVKSNKDMTYFSDKLDPERERLLVEAINRKELDDCIILECLPR